MPVQLTLFEDQPPYPTPDRTPYGLGSHVVQYAREVALGRRDTSKVSVAHFLSELAYCGDLSAKCPNVAEFTVMVEHARTAADLLEVRI